MWFTWFKMIIETLQKISCCIQYSAWQNNHHCLFILLWSLCSVSIKNFLQETTIKIPSVLNGHYIHSPHFRRQIKSFLRMLLKSTLSRLCDYTSIHWQFGTKNGQNCELMWLLCNSHHCKFNGRDKKHASHVLFPHLKYVWSTHLLASSRIVSYVKMYADVFR